jgi:diaminopimelate epimerase
MDTIIRFSKYHGTGNDFIIINNDVVNLSGSETDLFQRMCNRNFGIGADGIMLVDKINVNHFNLRYYNANGSEAAMCGNGARCAVSFVHQIISEFEEYSFTIGTKTYRAEMMAPNSIKILWDFYPQIMPVEELSSIVPSEFYDFLVVEAGVPHLVLFVKTKLNKVDLAQWGPFFRSHPLFSPEGTNVNVITIGKNKISIRTYERGVERETLACGTGVLAAAIASEYRKKVKLPVAVETTGGILQVGVTPEDGSLWLQGPAQYVYYGELSPENL